MTKFYDILHNLDNETIFSITFTKKDGTERTYNKCKMHIPPENPTGTGITAKEHHQNYNNIMFWVEDEGPKLPGYRIANEECIKEIKITA